jgi:hypothetical protein
LKKKLLPGADETLSAQIELLCAGSHEVTLFPTMAWTWAKDQFRTSRWMDVGLLWDHAYAVLGRMTRRTGDYVVLRNPFGDHPYRSRFARGEWKSGAALNGGEPVRLGRSGVFALPKRDFDRCFHRIGWVELPPDDEPGL